MTPPRALFLDLDGTLLDGSGAGEAFARTCAEIAAQLPGVSAERLFAANRQVWAAYWPEVERDWNLGRVEGAAVSLEAWRRTLRACGYEDETLARRAQETQARYSHRSRRLFEDARHLLRRLAGRLPLALVTNGASDTQREKLRALGIEDRFAAVVVSGEHGVAKPDAAIFHVALAALGVAPQQVWHVGDSLAADVGGALNAGLTAVWLNRNGARRQNGDPPPHHEVASLMELPPLLE